MKYRVFTDGACRKNGYSDACAGWAYAIIDENNNLVKADSGTIFGGTNNIGELTAIIEGIKAAKALEPEFFTILSDSAYCINGITNWRYNWKKNNWWRDAAQTQELKNKDMWIILDSLYDSMIMDFEKVAGHAGIEWNEYVDKLAVAASRRER